MKSVFKMAVLTTALAFSGMVYASPAAEPLPQETLTQQLKLTPDQVQKVSTLREKAQKELDGIDTSNVKQDAIVDMFRSGEWSDRSAKRQLEAIGGIQTQVRFLRVKYLFDVSQVLTPEQKQQLQKMMRQNAMY